MIKKEFKTADKVKENDKKSKQQSEKWSKKNSEQLIK